MDDHERPLPVVERIASEDVVNALAAMEDRPWAEWGKSQKPLTQSQLARLLGRYEDNKGRRIGPKGRRLTDGRRLRGYEREQFTESWEFYPPGFVSNPLYPNPKCDTVTTRENTGGNSGFQSVTPDSCHTPEKGVSTSKNGLVTLSRLKREVEMKRHRRGSR